MGFGFTFIFVIILIPATIIFLLVWLLTKRKVFGQILGLIWLICLAFILFVEIVGVFTSKKVLKKKDYYGAYIVNRSYFPGKQADWQYDHFRFEITPEDSIFFYVTDNEKIIKKYRGTIEATKSYISERLIINMDTPTHHIMSGNPTVYRGVWNFSLVFYSPKFKNVCFKKGHWKPIARPQ